ncbi:hypothetical protein ACFV6E_00330 [Streptomyces sp. NPDC059785]|uniref:hypothetical protein n=1 Tax=Streptomyces sp. NPDC059785 TaxID=3346945 RepID=UPI0036698219
MSPAEQPPGGGQPDPHQRPNPYQRPGYQQPNPYQSQQPQQLPQPRQSPQQPWEVPTVTAGPAAPQPGGTGPGGAGPGGGGTGGGNRTRVIAIAAAAAVVVAAGVTGFALLGGGKDDGTDPGPTNSASGQPSSSDPRGTDADEPTVKGWKVVVNPDIGVAFDVPAEWALASKDYVSYVVENDDPEENPLVAMKAPAFLKEKWCGSDDDRDGATDYIPLAAAGSRGNNGAKSTEDIAGSDPQSWVYGAYTQPDKAKVESGTVESYTTESGIKGSLGTASSEGVEKSKKCATDGKATTFAFKNSAGDLVSWSFHGAKGVSDEVPDATVRKILSTVRIYQDPSDASDG